TASAVNLVINAYDRSNPQRIALLAIPEFGGRALTRPERVKHRAQVIFWEAEHDRNRLYLSDDQQTIRIGRMNHVAGIHKPKPDAARDRRGDARIRQLQADAVDLGAILIELGGTLAHR